MSDFKAKMHQIVCQLGLCLRPRWGSLQCSPDPLAGFRGLLLRREGKDNRGREERGKGEGREGMGRGVGRVGPKLKLVPPPELFSWRRRCYQTSVTRRNWHVI